MSATWEVIVPVVVAIYSQTYGNNKCEINPASTPIAENVCQGLRAGLEDGCNRLLSVPIANTKIEIVGRYSVTPVQFPLLVKQKIGEAYHACDLFWSGDNTFDQYRQRLASKASVLNELFSALPTAHPALETMSKAMRAVGVTDAEMKNTSAAAADVELQCKTSGNSTPIVCNAGSSAGGTLGSSDSSTEIPGDVRPPPVIVGSPPLLTIMDIKALEDSIALLSAKVGEIEANPPAAHRVPVQWQAISEIGFATASHAISWNECKSLAKRIGSAESKPRRILIVGSADARGEISLNESLSLRRAASVALCLSSALGLTTINMQITGTGAASAPSIEYTRVRAATVYAGYE